jgi:pimeloyl-ACP methyl ester carboxylesterase
LFNFAICSLANLLFPQGKFQLVMLPAVGHCVQEDSPDLMAKTLLKFAQRVGTGARRVPVAVPTFV